MGRWRPRGVAMIDSGWSEGLCLVTGSGEVVADVAENL